MGGKCFKPLHGVYFLIHMLRLPVLVLNFIDKLQILLKQKFCEDLPYSIGKSTQYSVMVFMGKEWIYVYE